MESLRRGERADCCATDCSPNDLTTRKAAWLLWCLPSVGVLVGFFWAEGRAWIWIPAFLVMGGGCLANATRCGRLHCYFTGPLYILAALYVALSMFGYRSFEPRPLLVDRPRSLMRSIGSGNP